MTSNASIDPIDLSPAAWQTTVSPSTANSGLVMPPPDSRFILAQLVTIPTAQNARMPAYKRFVNAPTSLMPAANDRQQQQQQHVGLHEIRLADVAWDYERGRPMHPLALRVCTNERIVGGGAGGAGRAVPDLGVCTCEEGTCCGIPKDDEAKDKQAAAVESSCCGSSKPPTPSRPAAPTANGAARNDGGPLPRYECATGTCAPLSSVDDPLAAPRLPSCCGGGGGDSDSQGAASTSSSNPRMWVNRVLVGYLRLSSTTQHSDSSPGTQASPLASSGSRRDHHIQLDLEPDGPAMTVPGLIPHIFTVIATHVARGGDSDGVLSSIKRSLKQQRPGGNDDRVHIAVRKRDLALRVAVKQMGSPWAVLPAAKTEDGDDAALHVVYVAQLADLLSAPGHRTT